MANLQKNKDLILDLYKNKSAHHSSDKLFDPFKDTVIRYLGYINEFGEAFKYVIPKSIYYGTYVVATAYALSDSVHKAYLAKYVPNIRQ